MSTGLDAPPADERRSRRGLFSLATATIAGVAAGVVAGRPKAASASVTNFGAITVDGSADLADGIEATTAVPSNAPARSAVWAHTADDRCVGVSATHDGAGTALDARSGSGLAVNAIGNAPGFIVMAENQFVAGAGVQVTAAVVGVEASASAPNGRGLTGFAGGPSGAGVVGGASGQSGIGVWGSSSGPGGAGVFAVGGGAAAVGLFASGDRAAIVLEALYASPSASAGAPHVAGELFYDKAGNLWLCTAGGSPGTFQKIAGPAAAGAFHPITPARVYDSRMTQPAPGALAAGEDRIVSVADQRDVNGGAVVAAGVIPGGATAVTVNVTITQTSGSGFLSVNPGGNTVVSASAINWVAEGINVANQITVPLGGDRQLTVIAGGAGATHFILDVSGYYL